MIDYTKISSWYVNSSPGHMISVYSSIPKLACQKGWDLKETYEWVYKYYHKRVAPCYIPKLAEE